MQSLKVSGYIKKISRQLTEHLTVLVIIISVALISFVGIFLYKNFYMTIISAKSNSGQKSATVEVPN